MDLSTSEIYIHWVRLVRDVRFGAFKAPYIVLSTHIIDFPLTLISVLSNCLCFQRLEIIWSVLTLELSIMMSERLNIHLLIK